MSLFKILSVGEDEYRMALTSDDPDFEDVLIETCAVTVDMDYIVTRDKKILELSRYTVSLEALLAKVSNVQDESSIQRNSPLRGSSWKPGFGSIVSHV